MHEECHAIVLEQLSEAQRRALVLAENQFALHTRDAHGPPRCGHPNWVLTFSA
jgi:hypothetical protein